jgi:flagellar basal-body rod protein FlgB
VDFSQAPFFSLLRGQLQHLGARQRVVSENIANASTPGYVPRDTDEAAFAKALTNANGSGSVTVARTNPGHIGGSGSGNMFAKIIKSPDSETTMDGNAVVLEEQMMRAAETRMNYETNLALYQKGLQLVRLAMKAPGR